MPESDAMECESINSIDFIHTKHLLVNVLELERMSKENVPLVRRRIEWIFIEN